MNLLTSLVLFIFWIVFIPISLHTVAEKISLLGIYHKIDNEGTIRAALMRYRDKEKEGIISKIKKVFYINVSLTMPFFFAYYIVINSTLNSHDISSYDVCCLAFLISLVSLLSIRILANVPINVQKGIYRLYPKAERINVRKMNQERIISFFHSFVCASLIVLGIILSSNIISNSALLKTETSDFRSFETVGLICTYFGLLLLLTAGIEILFYFFPPWILIEQYEE